MAFDVFLRSGREQSPRRRWRAVVGSVAVHLLAGVALGLHSLWGIEEISPVGVAVTFLSVGTPPVPPPPVASRKPRAALRSATIATVRHEPLPAGARPRDPRPLAADTDDGLPDPFDGGGVPRPTTRAAAPPPRGPALVEPPPAMLGPGVGVGRRLSDLSDPRFRPTLPPALNRPGVTVSGLFRICVSVAGQVNDVTVLRSADPLVDGDWAAVIRRWQYRPLTLNGRPTPFCYPLTLEVQAMRG
jgi:hypothetical protein